MTSTALVQSEIERFLQSSEPEVICITGEWGVGKTYTWQAGLNKSRSNRSIALSRYSYASLFGISSLDALKLALFENLNFLDAPPSAAVENGPRYARWLGSRAKKLNQLTATIPVVGQALSKAGPLYFSLIRNQIVCIDDLERRGRGLDLKDIFGLVSFLREQRSCKVVLLLNADALGDERGSFDTYFEKVIDTRLIFSPTADDATRIALRTNDRVTDLLRQNCITLGISNIRVIKKIERLIRQIAPHLTRFSPELTQQAVHSLTLFGWSKFQPNTAPPFDAYRESSLARSLRSSKNGLEASPDDEKWVVLLDKYRFTSMDDFDLELRNFADSGVLDILSITSRASEQNTKIESLLKTGSLEKAWRPFHDLFDANLEEVTRSIVDGMKANVSVESLANLDETIRLLKELGRENEANDILACFVANKSKGFWDASADPSHRGPFDPDVAAAIAAQQATATVPFDAEAELIRVGRTHDAETIKMLAEFPVEEYCRVIKSKRGEEMRKVILSGLEFQRISNASPEMQEVVRRTREALKQIASELKLNALRVRKYGIKIDDA